MKQVVMPLSILHQWKAKRIRALASKDEKKDANMEDIYHSPLEPYEPVNNRLDQLVRWFWTWVRHASKSSSPHWITDCSVHDGQALEEWLHPEWSFAFLLRMVVTPSDMRDNIAQFQSLCTHRKKLQIDGFVQANPADAVHAIDPVSERDTFIDGIYNLQIFLKRDSEPPWMGRMTLIQSWMYVLLYVKSEADLRTYFDHMRDLGEDTLGTCEVYLNVWDEEVLQTYMTETKQRQLIGNSSCCLEREDGLILTNWQPYTLYWQNTTFACVYVSVQEVQRIAHIYGFTCVQQRNVVDLVYTKMDYSQQASCNDWWTARMMKGMKFKARSPAPDADSLP
jgi:hypothetical protein